MKVCKIVIGKLGYSSQVKYFSGSECFKMLLYTYFDHIPTSCLTTLLHVFGERPSKIEATLYIHSSFSLVTHQYFFFLKENVAFLSNFI